MTVEWAVLTADGAVLSTWQSRAVARAVAHSIRNGDRTYRVAPLPTTEHLTRR